MNSRFQILEKEKLSQTNTFDEINHGNKLGYFLTYLLIFCSAIFGDVYFLGIAFTFTAIIWILKKKYFDKSILYFIFFLCMLVIIQALKFQMFFLITTTTLFIRFLFPYFALKLIGRNFTRYYINIIYFLTIISLFYIYHH